jgi:two-component system chemotaxis response regulator CheY
MASEKKVCLIVDDSRAVRKVMAKIIDELALSYIEASDGQEALQLCQQQMPDVILLDWNMPNMDGMEFFVAFQQVPGHETCRVVFCTTETEMAKVIVALDAGADEYIMKPFTKEIVESKLQQVGVL